LTFSPAAGAGILSGSSVRFSKRMVTP